MSRMRRGFTLIEVALFLAVTGALFAGIMIGTQNSIWQQRYNDTVQNFANFLRNVYFEVSNPQSLSGGRSDQAIYGKLISFGQTVGLDGETLGTNEQRVFVYDVVGDATGAGTGSVVDMLISLHANVAVKERDAEQEITGVVPAGIVESYAPIWGSAIEATEESDIDGILYKGTILIVRHPRSGTINTLVSNDVIEINNAIEDANYNKNYAAIDNLLFNMASVNGSKNKYNFAPKAANFCVNPDGVGEASTMRRNIRIISNARNASGVEVISLDSDDNLCSQNN